MSKKILLSAVQPSGQLHIGNYFGAVKQFVDMQSSGKYDCVYMIVNYHALNTIQDPKVMRENTLSLAIDYLALGLDPAKSLIFKQSDVSAHTELTWIFDTLVSVPFLQRAHAFKDKEAKNHEISVGLFNYPVLMATDILLYNTDLVPVGRDQKQHVEYARDIAQKFNNTFGDTFKLPEVMIMEHVAIVPGIDGRKMSKSYGNTIPLFATRDEIQKAVMAIVTDSKGDVPTNVYNIHKLFKSEADLKKVYKANAGKYKALKEALIEDIDAFIKPLRERRAEVAKDEARVLNVLKEGAVKANEIAQAKLREVKEKIGVL